MSDLLLLLQFMIIPIAVTLLFALTLPLLGTSLAARNEILVPLTLPVLSGMILSLFAMIGIPEDLHWVRVAGTIITVFIIYQLFLQKITAPLIRQLTLAGMLIGSEALTRLMVSLKPEIQGEFTQLLNGEMLAISSTELILVCIISFVVFATVIIFFPRYRIYTLDETLLKRFPQIYKSTDILMKIFNTISVVFGVITIGPLVTTALLVLAPLFGNNGRSSFSQTVIFAVSIAIVSVMISFPVALASDLPPAYVVSTGVLVIGAVFSLLMTLYEKMKRPNVLR